MNGNAAVHVYRIVQESLNNVTRHSGAKESWVRLRFLPQALELEVEDHGCGFDAKTAKQGIGLVAIRERAELLGGKVEFGRPAQGGTLMRLRVPREAATELPGKFHERSWKHMADEISVLLVDDHSLVRRGFRRILEDEPDMKVVGEAADGAQAIKLADELQPKVIVMDCAMPGVNGLDATRQILAKHPEALVLMLSMHPEETLVRQALDAGARGYVLKNAVDLELGIAIRRVVAGETVLDSQLKRPESVLRGKRSAALTPRELEVLQMIVEGKSNKEIATLLDLSANTVAVHRANMMDALGMHKTAELVVYAIRNGLVNLP